MLALQAAVVSVVPQDVEDTGSAPRQDDFTDAEAFDVHESCTIVVSDPVEDAEQFHTADDPADDNVADPESLGIDECKSHAV
ncbi:MAG TPA: hypothetical protein VLF59_02160 [Candidatus Saccharimonadales bacterium]|nr:hypothetical protein [Candidatus Saccharimonadales bacterium]